MQGPDLTREMTSNTPWQTHSHTQPVTVAVHRVWPRIIHFLLEHLPLSSQSTEDHTGPVCVNVCFDRWDCTPRAVDRSLPGSIIKECIRHTWWKSNIVVYLTTLKQHFSQKFQYCIKKIMRLMAQNLTVRESLIRRIIKPYKLL